MGRKKLPEGEIRQLMTFRCNREDLSSTEVRIIVEEGPKLIEELLQIINREKIKMDSSDYSEIFEKWLGFKLEINASDSGLRDILLVLGTAFGKDRLKKVLKEI
jgi:hypothetical protein